MGTTINIDGFLHPPDQARIPVFDRGFLYGDSVYEVVRTYQGIPFALDRHLERLARSAAQLEIVLPETAWLEAQLEATLRAADNPESYIRIIVTRGSGPITLDPSGATSPLTVILVKALEAFPDWTYEQGISVTIPAVRRMPRSADAPAAKTGNYLNSVLALGQAKRLGSDDALLLDVHGRVAEATSANVFVARDGSLCTPTRETGLLTGVTRALLMEIASAHEISCEECEVLPEDLYAADEVLLTSTLREVMPVTRIDEKVIGTGQPGPLATKLLTLFRQHALELVQGPS